ncbi:hypothetical protein NBRC110019_04410 [Neptunitalea chrysea]|uniref:Uncharacterized protein n=1 Tax=Neptunitalea chrysea TaxID=1647581 RepID=A0A9W6B4Y3_9FLAO|nr:hypothetical protein [Neptunitalea chrysea]GLB51402.1 hypothetical protein NBRC110019_04410 [Neptunitalea chrysea]
MIATYLSCVSCEKEDINFINSTANAEAAPNYARATNTANPYTVRNMKKANASQGTDGVFETTFHELGHASHFKKVGSSYWIKYINYIITYGAYGDGHGMNNEYVALGEAWGYHIGYFLTLQEFGSTNGIISINGFENFDPVQKPSNADVVRYGTPIYNWRGWIPAGIILDITDTQADWVRTGYRDNVSGYTYQNIYNAMDSDVTSPQKLRDRLLSENGNLDETDLRNLFEAYYWD